MNGSLPDFDEFQALLDALVEESITPEQMKRLEAIVLAHPEAEAYYVKFMSMYAELAAQLEKRPAAAPKAMSEAAASPPSPTPVASTTPWRKNPRLVIGALAGMAAIVLLTIKILEGPPAPIPGPYTAPQKAAEPLDSTVAVLVQAPGAQWEDTGLPTRPGAPLPPGTLRLKSGLAHLEFYCGAMVILEGPVEFKLVSRTEGFCVHGKLRARVPPQAHGFAIGTPKLFLVDRGTEFGLDVGADQRTEVHVFDGKVDLYDPAKKKQAAREVAEGHGIRMEAAGTFNPIAVNPKRFTSPQDLVNESQAEVKRLQQSWLAASTALRKDKSLLAYYPFQTDSPFNRTLLDQAGERGKPRDGAIVGCSWVSSRWPGRQGLEFKRVSDRVRIKVPGEHESLTLMTWVRIDALPNQNNALMMSDGYPPGALHWQIGETGTIILGVQNREGGRGANYHAVQKVTPEHFGQWLHLAVVYDKEAQTVTHYMNGRPVAQAELEFEIPLRIGEAELGNWNVADFRNNRPVRNLYGCMDEFFACARPLSEEEIGQMFRQGQPPR